MLKPLILIAALAATPVLAQETPFDGLSATDLTGMTIVGDNGDPVGTIVDVLLLGDGPDKAVINLDVFPEGRARTVLFALEDLTLDRSGDAPRITTDLTPAAIDALLDYDAG